MGRSYRERRVYQYPQAEVRVSVERAMHELGMPMKPGASEWEIRATRSFSAKSWGERLTIHMATFPGGGTQVIAESKLVFGLVDWGRNQSNIEEIYDSMAALVGPGEVAPLDQ